MDTTTELDARLATLRAEVETLRRELDALRVAAADDPDIFAQLPALQARLQAYPAIVGDLTRRRVLAHLAELKAEADDLRPEYERLDALDTARRAAVTTWRKDPRGKVPATQTAYLAEGAAIDAEYAGVTAAFDRARLALQTFYVRAAKEYGVGLDGSAFESWATGRRNNYPLPHDRGAWEAAARQRGQAAERRALQGQPAEQVSQRH
jgi:hypothetical protein